MYVVIDREGRVLVRTRDRERAHRAMRMARSLGCGVLLHDTRQPRERAILDRQVRVVISGKKERYFGEVPAASAWARRHLAEKMTIGAHARFYRGNATSSYAVLRLTERGVVVTKGANVGSVA